MSNDYLFNEMKTVVSPSLIYYRDIIQRNIQLAVTTAGGSQYLWPHVKSHKMADVMRLSINSGICRFKCATIAEAETAASCGARHVLLSYPLVGPNITRFLQLQHAYPYTCFYATADNIELLRQLAQVSLNMPEPSDIKILIDINMGMNRTGVLPDEAVHFCKQCKEIDGISLAGIHCYDGNCTDSDVPARRRNITNINHTLKKLFQDILFCCPNCNMMVIGGTPSFPYHALEWKNFSLPSEFQVFFSPGTVFIYDSGYQKKYPDLPYTPGAGILTRVISHPAESFFTLDCGYKAIAADPSGSRGVLLGVSNYEEVFQSEEHWTFRMKSGHESERPAIGQELIIIPTHICPTSALYSHAIVIEKGTIVAKWPVTARNRKILY